MKCSDEDEYPNSSRAESRRLVKDGGTDWENITSEQRAESVR